MLAPRSFTREDLVEIYAHGGASTLHGVLDAALKNGARLALPGEFTKRAFLNGRINLTQAEAVMDLIGASSEAARTASLRQLSGGLSGRVARCRDVILRWMANISLSVDYPEHEEEALNRETIIAEGRELLADMQALLQTAEIGRVLREGIKTAIIGAPNAGKSTLLNAILGEDRAITHELPGTTRDILTEQVQINGVPLVLMDTAGLRETDNPVEKMGLERTREAMRNAELILYVADGTQDDKIELKSEAQKIFILVNKYDLPITESRKKLIENKRDSARVIPISAKTGQGLDKLYAAIQEAFLLGLGREGISGIAESDIITRERHKVLLSDAVGHLTAAVGDFEAGLPEDIAAVNLRAAYLSLGHILGLEYADDIIDRIFEEFCVGK
jgi:tRNA modification GTPase